MSKILYDNATKKWFKNHVGHETTACKCEITGGLTMDYQEAIERLEREYLVDSNGDTTQKDFEALKIAISAMQELQSIHDNGISLERLKDIDFRKQVVEHINYMEYMRVKDELEDYKQLGDLEEIKNAVEKQHPNSPTYDGDGYAPDGTFVWDEWVCPCCGSRFEVEYEEHDYCPNCGQSILWEE